MEPNYNAYLSTIITVVDADRIYTEFLADLEDAVDDAKDMSGDADIINLVMDQIEFCNVILLNKCDLLSREQLNSEEEQQEVFREYPKVLE